MKKTFYRIGQNEQSLWYDKQGNFTGVIHTQYDFLEASKLLMPFDTQLVGYLSVADSMHHLEQWFSKEEMVRLQKSGFSIGEYEAEDYKFYEPYQHMVINQQSSRLVRTITL